MNRNEARDNHDEAIKKIKMDMPNFIEDQFVNIVKLKFAALYRSLKSSHTALLDTLCTDEYLSVIQENKNKILNLDDDIDFINIQTGVIKDYRSLGGIDEIDVDLFLFYIDYMVNNKENADSSRKRYLDKAYKVTLQAPFGIQSGISNNVCPRCGGVLTKNAIRYSYTCDYCHYEKFMNYDEWKISNIEEI